MRDSFGSEFCHKAKYSVVNFSAAQVQLTKEWDRNVNRYQKPALHPWWTAEVTCNKQGWLISNQECLCSFPFKRLSENIYPLEETNTTKIQKGWCKAGLGFKAQVVLVGEETEDSLLTWQHLRNPGPPPLGILSSIVSTGLLASSSWLACRIPVSTAHLLLWTAIYRESQTPLS